MKIKQLNILEMLLFNKLGPNIINERPSAETNCKAFATSVYPDQQVHMHCYPISHRRFKETSVKHYSFGSFGMEVQAVLFYLV